MGHSSYLLLTCLLGFDHVMKALPLDLTALGLARGLCVVKAKLRD